MRFLTILLAAILAVPFQPARAQAPPMMLNLVIVQGDGAINNIRQRTARDPIVRVEDENHKPVAGAVVVFTLPTQGAGGTFAGGVQTLTVMSNNQGLATARGFRPNQVQGNFQIHVNASVGSQTATATIAQSNALAAAAGAGAGAGAAVSGKLIAIIAIAAGAAVAGGVAAATHGGGSSTAVTPATPTTISAGGSTVGAPR